MTFKAFTLLNLNRLISKAFFVLLSLGLPNAFNYIIHTDFLALTTVKKD
jgi:hypothetical protein